MREKKTFSPEIDQREKAGCQSGKQTAKMHSNCPVSLKSFPPLRAEVLAKAQSSRRPRADRPERGEKLRVNILKGVQWRAACHFAGLAGDAMGPLS